MDEAKSPTAGGDAETLKVNNDENKVAGKDVRKTNTTPLKLEITDRETPLKEETNISNTKGTI